mmetsp:Transcript_36506/g.106872  ORF Transcript_36506/g.106872 Transcript_36506/m.106872 type:complete len:618 (-) Transcript_36506:79-1932(-)
MTSPGHDADAPPAYESPYSAVATARAAGVTLVRLQRLRQLVLDDPSLHPARVALGEFRADGDQRGGRGGTAAHIDGTKHGQQQSSGSSRWRARLSRAAQGSPLGPQQMAVSPNGGDSTSGAGGSVFARLAARGGGLWAPLECAWGYSPLEGVHAPTVLRGGVYSLCHMQLMHQAYVRLARTQQQHAHGRPERVACACGARIRVLVDGLAELVTMYSHGRLAELHAVARINRGAPAAMHFAMANGSLLSVAAAPMAVAPREPPTCARGTVPVIFPCHAASVELHWLTRVMMRGCGAVEELCFGDLLSAHALGPAGIAAVDSMLCAETVMVLQDQQYAAALALLAARGYSPRSFALVHISHSFIYADEAPAAAVKYASWRAAFRNNWFADAASAGAHHSLQEAASRGQVEWYPLGVGSQWVRLMPAIAAGELHLPAASARVHFLSFLGSTDKSDREPRLAAVREALGPTVPFFSTHGRHACYGFECNNTDYVDGMLQSAFSLHLPGSTADSGRLWEALEAGAIPVVVEEFGPGEAQVGTDVLYGEEAARVVREALRPLEVALGAPLPFVVVRSVGDLPGVLQPLWEEPARLDSLQSQLREWWAAVKGHFAERFRRALCS